MLVVVLLWCCCRCCCLLGLRFAVCCCLLAAYIVYVLHTLLIRVHLSIYEIYTWYLVQASTYTHPKHNKHIYVQLGTLVRSYILSPRRAQSPDRLSNNQPFTLACAINRFTIINGFVVQATPLAHILFLLFTRVALGAYRRRPWCLVVVLVTPTQHIEA